MNKFKHGIHEVKSNSSNDGLSDDEGAISEPFKKGRKKKKLNKNDDQVGRRAYVKN